jgi:hypothetical protein
MVGEGSGWGDPYRGQLGEVHDVFGTHGERSVQRVLRCRGRDEKVLPLVLVMRTDGPLRVTITVLTPYEDRRKTPI